MGKKVFLASNEDLFIQQYDFLKNLTIKVDSKAEVFPLVVQNYSTLVDLEELSPDEILLITNTIESLCEKVNQYRKIEGNVIKNDLLDWLSKIDQTKTIIAGLGDKRIETRRSY